MPNLLEIWFENRRNRRHRVGESKRKGRKGKGKKMVKGFHVGHEIK